MVKTVPTHSPINKHSAEKLIQPFIQMFTTKLWDKNGLVVAIGPPGSENSFLSDHIVREARASGLSAKKMFHRLDQHRNWIDTQVVSFRE